MGARAALWQTTDIDRHSQNQTNKTQVSKKISHLHKGKYFGRNCIFLPPSARIKYLISSPSNLNFDVISPWLEKNLNLAPLKCRNMLPNCPEKCQFSDSLTKNKELCKNTLKINSSLWPYFFPKCKNVRMSYLFPRVHSARIFTLALTYNTKANVQ